MQARTGAGWFSPSVEWINLIKGLIRLETQEDAAAGVFIRLASGGKIKTERA